MRLLQLTMRPCSSLSTLSAMSLGRGLPCQPILSSATERERKALTSPKSTHLLL